MGSRVLCRLLCVSQPSLFLLLFAEIWASVLLEFFYHVRSPHVLTTAAVDAGSSPTTAAPTTSSAPATAAAAAAGAGAGAGADTSPPAGLTMTTGQLRYSFENGLPRNRVGVCEALARTGNLDLLRLAREMGCPFHIRTATAAAERGHLHVLKWIRARENGRCPWHENTCMAAAQGEASCLYADMKRDLYSLFDLSEPACLRCPWHQNTCTAAAQGGTIYLSIYPCRQATNLGSRARLVDAFGYTA